MNRLTFFWPIVVVWVGVFAYSIYTLNGFLGGAALAILFNAPSFYKETCAALAEEQNNK